jgi:hypothetical protein
LFWSLGQIVKAVLAALLVAALLTPFLMNWPTVRQEQDGCSFGPVTNATYRAMLSKARTVHRTHWLWIVPGDYKHVEQALLDQYLLISDRSADPYIKIAAMHAVLRSWGAEFRNVRENAFIEVSNAGRGTVSFNYSLATPRFDLLALPGEAWLIGSLKGPHRETTANEAASYRQGRFDFIAHFPNPLDPIPEDAVRKTDLACPPVPPNKLSHLFEGEP